MLNQIKNYDYKYGLNIEIKPEIDLSILESIKPGKITLNDERKISINFEKEFENKKITMDIKKNTELTLEIKSSDKNKASLLEIEINLEKNTSLKLLQIQKCDDNSNIILKRKINQKENSTTELMDLIFGAKYAKQETTANLQGENSKNNQKVIYLSKNNQKQDIYTASNHINANTESDLLIRGIVKDKAKTLSRSLIKIEEQAKNSRGYEKQETLILDDSAEADAIPNLEINNNEVQCSHGSTIGQINEEMLFYLMSRGLNINEAKNKIIAGYFNPIIDKIQDKELKEKIIREIQQ